MTFVLVKNMLFMKLWDKFIPKKREIRLFAIQYSVIFDIFKFSFSSYHVFI